MFFKKNNETDTSPANLFKSKNKTQISKIRSDKKQTSIEAEEYF